MLDFLKQSETISLVSANHRAATLGFSRLLLPEWFSELYKMAAKKVNKVKLSDEQIDLLITAWHLEPSLWDSTDASYSNADLRKAALRRISEKMNDLDTGTAIVSGVCMGQTKRGRA
jgi:hypothetical protein